MTAFGATPGGYDDDAPGIHAAIDSGQPIVYLPHGIYKVKSPVILRGGVRKMVGFQSSIGGADDAVLVRYASDKPGDARTPVETWLRFIFADNSVEKPFEFGLGP